MDWYEINCTAPSSFAFYSPCNTTGSSVQFSSLLSSLVAPCVKLQTVLVTSHCRLYHRPIYKWALSALQNLLQRTASRQTDCRSNRFHAVIPGGPKSIKQSINQSINQLLNLPNVTQIKTELVYIVRRRTTSLNENNTSGQVSKQHCKYVMHLTREETSVVVLGLGLGFEGKSTPWSWSLAL